MKEKLRTQGTQLSMIFPIAGTGISYLDTETVVLHIKCGINNSTPRAYILECHKFILSCFFHESTEHNNMFF